jgi:hypothetical protein
MTEWQAVENALHPTKNQFLDAWIDSGQPIVIGPAIDF